VKTFIIPTFLSKAALISVSKDLTKEINKLIYGFIWKGNDKIKTSALINDIENGGLKMLDTESMISAQRVMALKKYFADGYSSWKAILDEFLCNVGRKFILFCDFDTRKLPAYIPAFYKECLDAWSELKTSNVVSYENVIDQIIWNNKKLLLTNNRFSKNICFVRELLKLGTCYLTWANFFKVRRYWQQIYPRLNILS